MNNKQELLDKIKKLGFQVRQTGYKDEDHEKKNLYTYRYWILPEENYKLKNTPFFFNGGNDFLHFTSLEALFGILNSRHIRLYNLPNMDDKFELDYALKSLEFKKFNPQNKEDLYIFSLCSSSAILNEEFKKTKHLLWKLHGRNGHGVIIRLRIINDLNHWYNYYLAKCFYNLDNFDYIKELNEITDNELLDVKFACFIKLPIYEFENEIRLVFDKRNSGWITGNDGNRKYPIIYPDKLNKTGNISYVQLPIYNFFENDTNAYPTPPNGLQLNYEIPKISITEIILGYRYNEIDLNNIREKIIHFDPKINVRISDLKEFY